jgi:hypothetical protein
MVQFNLARLNLLTRATSEFKLMVDADGDFTNGATLYSATSKVDSFLNFDNITFTNGQYFSLLTSDDEVTGPGGVTSTIAWWYKGDVGFTSGATTTWEDNSSSGLHLTQATVARQPLNTKYQNYNKVVTYDGSDAMNNAVGYWKLTSGNTAFNFYAVTKRITGQGSVNALFSENTNQGDQGFFNGYNGNRFYSNFWANRYAYTNDPPAKFISGTPLLVSSRYSSTGSIQTIAINGLNESLTGAGAFTSFNGTNSNLVIGNHINQSSWPFEGDIAEIMMFPSDLSASDRNKVESYLAIKWGTTLNQSPGQNYVASNSATKFYDTSVMTIYKNNIAGIGRDLCAGLHQKQSRSVNRSSSYDSIVAMGLTEIYTGNEENPDTLTNLSFMMWADDGISGSQITEVPTALTNGGCIQVKRLSREWRVQETGTVGAVQVQMNLGGVVAKSTEIGDIRLLIDNDNNFGNGGTTIVTPTTYDETTRVATFDNINFTNGQFFTIVTNIAAGGPGGVITNAASQNGVKYDLYSTTDVNLSDGVQGTLKQSGYTNTLTNPDDDMANEIVDNFSLVLNTNLSINNAGIYQFQLGANDDSSYVYIDGNFLFKAGVATVASPTISLTAGMHSIQVLYHEINGTNTINLQWRGTTAGLDTSTSYVGIADYKLFLPTSASITAWYRADKGTDYVSEAGNTTTMEDQTANGNDVSLIVGNPLYYKTTAAQLINYNPAITFTDDQLQSADDVNGIGLGKQDKTVFSVVTKTTYNGGAGWITALGQNSLANQSFGTYTTTTNAYLSGWTGNTIATSYFGTTDNNVPKILSGTYKNNSILATNNTFLYGNGRQIANATQAWSTNLDNDEDLSIGTHNSNTGDGHDGKIMEVINYPWTLSFAERQRVNSYLAIKYGITLDTTYVASDATTIWNDVANAGYGNNIAGIGLDSCSGLNQKQSRSVNPTNDGSIVAIGNYAIANSNYENANNFSADKTFMIWGDDGATGVKTTEVPTASLDPDACRTYKRLNREWKVQETKTVGDVELRFYLGNTYSSATSAIGDFRLLVKNNSSDFSTGTVTVYNATSWDATNKYVTFANVNFANNDYFTLITDITSSNPGGVTYTPGDGSVGNPYKTIYDASSNTSAGLKNFNINGRIFQSYVDASGWVLVASGENTTDETNYAQRDTINLQSDRVLPPATLRLLDINNVRMNNTGGGTALNVTTADPETIDRLVNNTTLGWFTGHNSVWSGTGQASMAANCDGGASTLNAKIWHSCGIGANLHWMPSNTTDGDGFGSSGDDADLNLWVRNTSHPMTAWYRADKGVTIATGASLWEDQGINARNASQPTVANQLLYNTSTNLINFNPSLNADGTNDFMTFSSIGAVIGGGARSMYGIATTALTDPTYRVISGYGTPLFTGEFFGLGRSSAISRTTGWTADHDVASVWTATNEPELVYMDYNGTQARGAFNGGSITGTARTWTTRHNSGGLGYVTARDGGDHWSGRIGEIIYFNYVLSTTDNQKLNSYLALKYGLTLNQTTAQDYLASDGTTKMWNATANATYKNRIAGLGRDDCSGLYQKQSQSQLGISDSTVLSMALSTFTTSNADNLNTIDSNKTFLVWGDDAGLLAEQSTEMPTAINTNGTCNQGLRIGREWKVQQTANKEIGYVQLKMDIDAVGINTRNLSKFRLVMHNSSDFTTATTFVEPASFTSGVLTFDNIQFTDTVTYLTLVTDTTTNIAPGGVVAGLQAWYKADAGVTTSTGVDNWTDQSVFGRNATQATGVNQPSYNTTGSKLINYNPSISHTASGHVLTITGGIPNVNVNAFAAARKGPQNVDWNTLLRGFSSDHLMITGQSNDNLGYFDNSGGGTKLSGFTFVNGQVGILGAYTRTTGTQGWNSLNGRNGTTIYNNILESEIGGIGYIGNCGVCASQQWGDISEIAVYNTATMTATERQRVESYMALKYGVTLDQTVATNYLASDGTTVMWTATGGDNPLFSKNIAGIGRDYCSGLYQKQSRSVNRAAVEDSMLAMGLSTLEATNADNTATIDTNLSFMVWGDNGRTGTIITDVPTAALDPLNCKTYKRLAREWKVQETKTVGTVALRFHLGSTYTNNASTAADFKLLIDVDTIFANTTNIIAASSYDATNKYVEFSYNFANNDYFTLVIDNAVAPGGVSTNLRQWLKADKGVSIATGVSQWDDQSVNGKDATQGTGGNQPVYNTSSGLLNFNPSMSFDGSNDFLTWSDAGMPSGATTRTMFGVGTVNSTTDGYKYMYGYGTYAGGQGSMIAKSAQLHATVGYSAIDHTVANVWSNTTQPFLVYSDYNGTQARGAHNGSGITGTARTWNTILNTGRVGATQTLTAEYWNGKISEVISYSGLLSATELKRVNSYLAIKYGRTLDQTTAQDYLASDGTTIPWDATTADNATYKNRIAGIGRDDCSGLNQKQSQSQDTISAFTVMTVGLDTIKTSNALNDGEFINNLSFLAWGDDNGSMAEQTTEVPTAINIGTCGAGKRIGREWKVQKTGTVDAVQMKFDITTANISTRPASQFRLAVHTSNDFTSATTFYRPSSFTSGVLTFDGVSFTADSAYMTIITDTIVNVGPGGVVAGLTQWLRADIGTTIATGVSLWEDQGGANRDAVQGTGANQPTLTSNALNYNPVLTFNGTSQQMTFSDIGMASGSANRSSFAVASNNSLTASFRYINFYGTNTSNLGFGLAKNTTNGYEVVGWTNNHIIANTWATSNRYRMVYGDYNGTQGRGSVDGGSITGTNRSWTTTLTGTGFIGSNPSNERWSGTIGEVISYNSVLSATDKRRVESYLALRHGLTLDQGNTGQDYLASNGSTIWTGNSTYRFNIAGIGLDSCSALNQKQSRSADTIQRGDVVAIGKGTIATDNATNGVLFDANRDFLVWGADSARGFKNTEFPASITSQACVSISRLQKEWKTQVSGTASQTTQVKYFLSGLIPSSTSILDLKLLVDTVDSDFGNGGTRIIDAAAYNETTQEVTFDNVVFKNNNYFTLLIDVYAIAPGGVTTGLKSWVRADKGVTIATGTEVSRWDDQSTNGFSFTQNTSANRPFYNTTSNLLNFNPTLSFDGNNDFMDASTFRVHPDSNSLFAVANTSSLSIIRGIISSGATGASHGMSFDIQTTGSLAVKEYDLAGSSLLNTSVNLTVNTPNLLSLSSHNGTNGTSLLINGKVNITATTTKNPSTSNYVAIGTAFLTSGCILLECMIPEVAIYDGEMSASINRNKVESYLAYKIRTYARSDGYT